MAALAEMMKSEHETDKNLFSSLSLLTHWTKGWEEINQTYLLHSTEMCFIFSFPTADENEIHVVWVWGRKLRIEIVSEKEGKFKKKNESGNVIGTNGRQGVV